MRHHSTADGTDDASANRLDEIVAACVEQVLNIIKEKQER
jgi:hypothetical protein